MFESVDDDGRTTEPCYTLSSHCVPSAKKEIGDQIKALDGPDTIWLFISSESLRYNYFNKTEIRYSYIYA